MLEMKLFEIRDRGTCMPAMGVKMSRTGMSGAENFIMENAGYGPDDEAPTCILLIFIGINKCHFDPYEWGDRTKAVSHHYIEKNFDQLESGQVVDVRFILGETTEPSRSDAFDMDEHIKSIRESLSKEEDLL